MRTRLGILLTVCTALLLAESPSASSGLDLTARIANVAGAPDTARFEILRWSTEDERDRLMAAWELKASTPAAPGAAKGAGKGAAKGRGSAPTAAAPLSPEASLAKALQETTTVGYVWSSENAGYAVRYAGKVANPDGSQRIILITQRRLGALNQLWKPVFPGSPNAYEFSVIELRTNSKGEGEGKVSLLGRIAADPAARIVTLENYQALPAVFENVRRKVAQP
jgi:hypothetical protein